MNYRCYLFRVDNHIGSVRILTCTDEDDAKRQCRQIIADSERFPVAEVWDGNQLLFRERANTSASTMAQAPNVRSPSPHAPPGKGLRLESASLPDRITVSVRR